MADRKYKDGQIVRYVGPDLVTYEQGKTYTVMGYSEAFDLYGIMSELDDEVYLLPDDVLKSLTEEEEKEIKISDRMFEYYHDTEAVVSGKDFEAVDEKRLSEILEIARDDIRNSRLKRERKAFENDSEYRIYLSDLSGEAFYMRIGEEALSQPLSEYCLYIHEFDQNCIVKKEDGDRYDWGIEGRVYDGSWPTYNRDLNDFLGKPTYFGYEFYPVSSCWLLDRGSLIRFADTFPEVVHPLDKEKLDKDNYVLIMCHWD